MDDPKIILEVSSPEYWVSFPWSQEHRARSKIQVWYLYGRLLQLTRLFTPKGDQFQISHAASPEILLCTAWRTWSHSLLKWKVIILPILTAFLYITLENVARIERFELGSQKVKNEKLKTWLSVAWRVRHMTTTFAEECGLHHAMPNITRFRFECK